MLVEMFLFQYGVLLISLFKYRTEKEDASTFTVYHLKGSYRSEWELSCGDS